MLGAIAVRSCGVQRTAVYQRRRPAWIAVYQVVWRDLEPWLVQRRASSRFAVRQMVGAVWNY